MVFQAVVECITVAIRVALHQHTVAPTYLRPKVVFLLTPPALLPPLFYHPKTHSPTHPPQSCL